MNLIIDPQNKTIKIDEEISIAMLLMYLDGLQDYKEYKIIPVSKGINYVSTSTLDGLQGGSLIERGHPIIKTLNPYGQCYE